MPAREDNYFSFGEKCQYCRALGGEDKHSPNCLIELPPHPNGDSHRRLSPHWHAGFTKAESTAVSEEERQAYQMGFALKEELLQQLAREAATAPAKRIDRAIASVSSPALSSF